MTVLAAAIQVLGGLLLAPLLPGAIQSLKARLQGRRGPSPLQPYRELRRLWGKGLADPQPTTLVYRLAPCLVAAASALALLLVPIAGRAPDWSLGNDAIVLVGLLALGRFALAASSWDTGSGFALMGSSPADGSSKNTTAGSSAMARARPARLRMPPLISEG